MGMFDDEMGRLRQCGDRFTMLDVMGYDEPARRRVQTEPCERETYISPEIRQAHAIGRLEALLAQAQAFGTEAVEGKHKLSQENEELRRNIRNLEVQLADKTNRLNKTDKELRELIEKNAAKARRARRRNG